MSRWQTELLASVVLAVFVSGPLRAQQPDACVGDCDGGGSVTVDELIVGVNILLGVAPLSRCNSFDANGDGEVRVGELVRSVTGALGGCVAPTPTGPTRTVTATPSRTMTSPPGASTATATATRTATGPPTRSPTVPAPTPSPSLTATGSATATVPAPRAAEDDPLRRVARVPPSTADALGVINLGFAAARPAGRTASGIELPLLRRALTGGGAGASACPLGGSADVDCAIDAGLAVRTTVYTNCRDREPATNLERVRAGTVIEGAADPTFCVTGVPDPSVAVSVELRGFRQELFAAAGGVIDRIDVDLSSTFVPSGPSCAGRDGEETVDGVLTRRCVPVTEPRCAAAAADVTLRAAALQLVRTAQGSPCRQDTRVAGLLEIDNRTTGERYAQQFRDFVVTELRQGGTREITQSGRVDIDCLGSLRFDSRLPMLFGAGAACPSRGAFEVTFLSGVTSGSLSRQGEGRGAGDHDVPASSYGRAAPPRGIVPAPGGFRTATFRSTNGQVYHVVQNHGVTPAGAEDVQLTTLVGSLDSVGECDRAPSEQSPAEAVVGAPARLAFPLADVVRSLPLPSAFEPCFNQNAAGGDGRLCFGPAGACTDDCVCRAGAQCVAFSIGDGVPLAGAAGGVPAARLVDPLDVSGALCAGFDGQSAYGFGPDQPTTSASACAGAPPDGVRLPGGAAATTLVVAYAAPRGTLFDVGTAGFALDTDGSTCLGTGVLDAVADRRRVPPPRFEFADSRVNFDFNGDDRIDKVQDNCLDVSLAECDAATVTPTATPTVGPPPPCRPEPLAGEARLTVSGSTAAAANALGAATCGDGGNHAPERVFEYVAPRAGVYAIDTLGSAYDTLLYVRAGDCTGAELACDDDAVTVQQSVAAVALAAGQRIAIVVDGSGTASGAFTLRIENVDRDGDGFSNQDEARRQTDPDDPESLPVVNARSAVVAYLNQAAPPVGRAVSAAVAYLNTFRRASGRAESAAVSYLNRALLPAVRSAYSGIVSFLKTTGAALQRWTGGLLNRTGTDRSTSLVVAPPPTPTPTQTPAWETPTAIPVPTGIVTDRGADS